MWEIDKISPNNLLVAEKVSYLEDILEGGWVNILDIVTIFGAEKIKNGLNQNKYAKCIFGRREIIVVSAECEEKNLQ